MSDFLLDHAPAFIIGFLVLLFAVITVAVYSDYADHRDHVSVEQIMVTGRDITRTADHAVSVSKNQVMTIPGSDVYLVFTEKEVFQANSVEIYGKLSPGKSYTVTVTGSHDRRISEVKP